VIDAPQKNPFSLPCTSRYNEACHGNSVILAGIPPTMSGVTLRGGIPHTITNILIETVVLA